MSILKSIFIIAGLSLISTGCITSQNPELSPKNQSSYVEFKSADGFKIDLPESKPTITNDLFNHGGFKKPGKNYSWVNTKDYAYAVHFYDLNNGKKSVTDKEKKDFFETYKKTVTEAIDYYDVPFTEKKYVFNGNEGVEIQADNTKANSKMIARIFIVNERLYYIGLTYNPETLKDSQIYQIADSFALTDSDSKNGLK